MLRLASSAAGFVMLGCLAGAPAQAASAVIDWPTYLRVGPGKSFTVLQEMARGMPVVVDSCTDEWCAVHVDSVAGYLDRSTLAAPDAVVALQPPATAAGCFDSVRTGYAGGETFRYCPR